MSDMQHPSIPPQVPSLVPHVQRTDNFYQGVVVVAFAVLGSLLGLLKGWIAGMLCGMFVGLVLSGVALALIGIMRKS